MNEYLKRYIELKKQFVATNNSPDSVRSLYAFVFRDNDPFAHNLPPCVRSGVQGLSHYSRPQKRKNGKMKNEKCATVPGLRHGRAFLRRRVYFLRKSA